MSRAVASRVVLCSLLAAGMMACRTAPTEDIAGESATETPDGLQLVVNEKHRKIFLKPGVDLSEFSQILIDPFMVSYTNPSEDTGGPVRTLDAKTEERLTALLQDGLKQKMELSLKFELVEEPGPEALRVQGWLYDVVVGEAPFEDSRNSSLCFSKMAAIVTVRHSQTAQALARVVNRARLSCSKGGTLYRTAEWATVKKGLEPWLVLVSRSLEELGPLSLDSDSNAP